MKVEGRVSISIRVILRKPTGNGLSVPVWNLAAYSKAASEGI